VQFIRFLGEFTPHELWWAHAHGEYVMLSDQGVRRPKILTFNHHESFLSTLSGVEADFDVVIKRGGLDLSWNKASRPVPSNFRLVTFDEGVTDALDRGVYDFVICHTIKNLFWLWRWRRQKFIFIAHIPLFRYTLFSRLKSGLKLLTYLLFQWTHFVRFVAVSEFKRESWGLDGAVTVLAPQNLGAPLPEIAERKIVVVCNELLRRREELGVDDIYWLARQVPVQVIGKNPGVEFGFQPADFSEFQAAFRRSRIYLYTIRQPYGDGYNTAMLEAMQLGLAIVTVENRSSPIIHGQNGLVGKTKEELLRHCQFLLSHPGEVERLGRAARKTIEDRFTESGFIDGWRQILEIRPANVSTRR
jgi:hypothetical protein